MAHTASGPGHRRTVLLDGLPTQVLADLPPRRNRLLFVGLHPSPASIQAGHYHPGRHGRSIWERLIEAGVLPPETAHETADDALVDAGHGITDLRKRPGLGDEVTDAELTAGVGPLWQKIVVWRPAAIVFLERRAAEIAAARPIEEPWGALDGVALAGRPCFLLPGPEVPAGEATGATGFLRILLAVLPED